MKFKVFAERIMVEETEVEADTAEQAMAIARDFQNDGEWETSHDVSWVVTSAQEVHDET